MSDQSHPSVVLADSDLDASRSLRAQIERLDFLVHTVDDVQLLSSTLTRVQPAALIVDSDFGTDGFKVVHQLRDRGLASQSVLLFLAFRPDADRAVEAMRIGADDYLTKPVVQSRLKAALSKCGDDKESMHAVGSEFLVGNDPVVATLRRTIRMAAPTAAPVWITGETGCGKDFIAREIHRLSARNGKPFVYADTSRWLGGDCLTMELDLFGSVGNQSSDDELGLCTRAQMGTLYLSDVANLSVPQQGVLLRLLREREYRRAGTDSLASLNLRLIAASRFSTQDLLSQGFMPELILELGIVPLQVPPLRQRTADISTLIRMFARRFSQQHRRDQIDFSPRLIEQLERMLWPGNVRQLSNLVEQLVIFSDQRVVNDVPAEFLSNTMRGGEYFVSRGAEQGGVPSSDASSMSMMDRAELQAISQALTEADGHVGTAASMLGIGQATLYRKLRRYGIRRTTWKTDTDQRRTAVKG